MGHHRPDVILVGRRLPDNENLGLGYLLGALRDAGVPAEMAPLQDVRDVIAVAERVRRLRPRLVGLSLPDGGSSLLALALGERLVEVGYGGTVIAGGGFATLARRWLLQRYGWLDAVVRHAGEGPVVAIARRLRAGRASLDGLPGVTTRAGDGPPAEVLDRAPLEIRPARGTLPAILGHRAAHVAASRGCPGRCAYCGPAALQDLERAEGRRAGHDPARLRARGVGRTRRRTVDSLCDEMAALWRERDVRYFYFVDEQLVPRRADRARPFLSAWRQGLRQRGVGALGIGCMTRSDLLGGPVLDDLVALGLVRAFVGIELATAGELRAYGRGGDPERGMEVMGALDRARVATVCNVMLVHPASTAGTIDDGLRFMEAHPGQLFEATQMQVYHGTRLHRRLQAEGRVVGNPLRYGYAFGDPAVARFAEVLARLRGEAFRDYSVAFGVHDLRLALALARRLGEAPSIEALWDRSAGLSRRLGAVRVAALRDALVLARRGGGYGAAGALVARTAERIEALREEVDELGDDLARLVGKPAPVYRPLEAVAASVITFALAGAALVGAGGPARAGEPTPGEPPTAGAEAAQVSCSEQVTEIQRLAVTEAVLAADRCQDYVVTIPPGGAAPTVETMRPGTMTTRVTPEPSNPREADVVRNVAAVDTRCLEGTKVGVQRGAVRGQLDALFDKAVSGCGADRFSVVIELDAQGKVQTVTPQDPSSADAARAARCVQAAAVGMTFPCLAGYRVVPEFVIIE